MFMILLAVMASATLVSSSPEPARDIQQVAIDAITGKSGAGPAGHENRGEVTMPSDPQVEIAKRILGRNVTYPTTSEQSAKPVDLQSAIANSISGRH